MEDSGRPESVKTEQPVHGWFIGAPGEGQLVLGVNPQEHLCRYYRPASLFICPMSEICSAACLEALSS